MRGGEYGYRRAFLSKTTEPPLPFLIATLFTAAAHERFPHILLDDLKVNIVGIVQFSLSYSLKQYDADV